jgi:hypothetical protein
MSAPDHEPTLRSIAFYLPQFHPIPENDVAWGPGFTEWTNVAAARPLFRGHQQPQIPADLGFYDLRLPETRQAQADLARRYGIDAFCYYHYWFNGRQVLERPFDEVLASGSPDFPFLLCWANENWTRAWDGGTKQVLLEQHHSEEDDRAHIRWLAKAFADPRYVRVNGRPLLLVYRAHLLPDAGRTAATWREECQLLGVPEPYLCRVESFPDETGDPELIGFDAAVEFTPHWPSLPRGQRSNRILRGAVRAGLLPQRFGHHLIDYEQAAQAMMDRPPASYRRFPVVAPGWDNSPRRRTGGIILRKPTPSVYSRWVEAAARAQLADSAGGIVFVNAWNEWAEGAHLEPDRRNGHAFLQAHRDALSRAGARRNTAPDDEAKTEDDQKKGG